MRRHHEPVRDNPRQTMGMATPPGARRLGLSIMPCSMDPKKQAFMTRIMAGGNTTSCVIPDAVLRSHSIQISGTHEGLWFEAFRKMPKSRKPLQERGFPARSFSARKCGTICPGIKLTVEIRNPRTPNRRTCAAHRTAWTGWCNHRSWRYRFHPWSQSSAGLPGSGY